MIRGINSKPFIDLDKYLDLEALDYIKEEIIFGICKSKRYQGSYGRGILYKDKYLDFREAEELVTKDPILHDQYVKLLSVDDKRFFLKLHYNCYSNYWAIMLRSAMEYKDKHDSSKCVWLNNANYFNSLVDWIEDQSLFSEIGRVTIFLSEHQLETPIHLDNPGDIYKPHCHEFAWIGFGNKRIFVFDKDNSKKYYTDNRAVFFNDIDYHGVEASSTMDFSLRIDGKFSKGARISMGSHGTNPLY